MFLSYITLAVALSLSVIAAYYSIAGLTAIFAAAVIPIIVMGSILELGKVVVTLWLHEYWRQCRLLMKMYLVPAVAALMLITSMGIFGFLSKAHSDQSLIGGDVQARIAVYDEKIKTSKDNIDANRKVLKQMDEAVDQVMGRSTSETGADKAVSIRRSQSKERARLVSEIATEQKTIGKLSEERAPIAAEVRKVEAEVGPIKYIAALVYGENTDTNALEAAVRWVIILLVIVFDPLAIMMLLAATESLKWEKQRLFDLLKIPEPVIEPKPVVVLKAAQSLPEKSIMEQHPYLNHGFAHFKNLVPRVYKSEPQVEAIVEVPQEHCTEDEEMDDEHPSVKAATIQWKLENPSETLKNQRAKLSRGEITELPWMRLIRAELPPETNTGFGNDFPASPAKGDSFVRIDSLPNRVFKYNGSKWISVDKTQTDNYTYNEAYLDHLIAKIDSGEYDVDLLSSNEQEQITQRLQKKAT